jgi:SWI/SNF-related matrix-associated actin-dependent regulator 1 of chromatin subfamily A
VLRLIWNGPKRRYEFHYDFPAEHSVGYPLVKDNLRFDKYARPPCWYTTSARRCVPLAKWADDATRARVEREAQGEPDPNAIRVDFDGERFRWYAPVQFNAVIKRDGRLWRFSKDPRITGGRENCWHTEDAGAVARAVAVIEAVNAEHPGHEIPFMVEAGARVELDRRGGASREAIEASRALTADIDVPHPPGVAYRDYQKAAIAYAMARPNVLFGDPMGVGKTIQALGVANADPHVRRILVICRATMKIKWRRECEKWLVRKMSVGIATGQKIPRCNVVIINYELLGKPTGRILRQTKRKKDDTTEEVETKEYALRQELAEPEIGWDMVIVDEAHRIKNPRARRTRLALEVRARRRLFLTGTPIPNSVKEAFTLLHALAPDAFPSRSAFERRYCSAREGPHGWDNGGASNLADLQAAMRATVMVRREKKDVLPELPPKRWQIIEMPPPASASKLIAREEELRREQEAWADELRARAEMARAAENPEEYRRATRELNTKMMVKFADLSRVRWELAHAKFPLVVEHLKAVLEEAEKVVVMGWHVRLLEMLREEFAPYGAVILHGQTPERERQRAVDDFQADAGVRLFFGNMEAAGEGIDLTAASLSVFAEMDYTPGRIEQAEDRIHRYGQHDSVLIQHLVLEGSYDARMIRTMVEKAEVIGKALDERAGAEGAPPSIGPDTARPYAGMPGRESGLPESFAVGRWVAEASGDNSYRVPPEVIAAEARGMRPREIAAVHVALREMAARCDGAEGRDGQGFTGVDVALGKKLAAREALSAKEAVLGKHLLWKYRNTQLGGRAGDLFGEE